MNGCFYEDEDVKLLEEMRANCIKALMKGAIYTDEKAERKALAIENILNRLKKAEEKNTCLHCGSKRAAYCEECYQELISENAKLQTEIKKKNRMIDEMLKDIGSMMLVKNRTDILLEVYESRVESEE